MSFLRAAAWVPLALAFATPLHAQPSAVQVGVDPDTVTVGDRFRAAVFVPLAGGQASVELPPAPDGRWQTVGEAQRTDSAGIARIVIPMAAWVPGPGGSAQGEVRLTARDGTVSIVPIAIPLPFVRAVLPADSTRPRDPRDVVDVPRPPLPWAWMLAALLVLALLAGWMWIHRRRGGTRVAADARQHALAELDRVRASGLAEAGDLEGFYARTSAVLREFMASTDPMLGVDLTSRELMDRLSRNGSRPDELERLAEVLADAELAKFARRAPSANRALDDWAAARHWVESFGAHGAPAEGEA
jgi:hypothetical protein